MPSWFVILAKVLAMLARLVPMVEDSFGSAAGAGAEKKAAVMGKVGDYVAGPISEQYPELNEAGRSALGRVVSATIDQTVSAANRAGVFAHGHRRPVGPGSGPSEGGDSAPPGQVSA